NGDNQYDASSVALVIDDFHKVFGLDSGGDGECTNEVVQDLSDFGMINRSWHFDENFNSKSSEWVLDESNNHDFAIAVDITFDNEEGLQISFSEWSKMKKHIQSKL
ncbi:MAG: hypothetical protein HRT73_06150, partial [Flavobacteriales bacterium]|nr:hypothetical protein [Flavobacteriales bacterium]